MAKKIQKKWLWVLVISVLMILNVVSVYQRHLLQKDYERLNSTHSNLEQSHHTLQSNIINRASLQWTSEGQTIDLNTNLSTPQSSDSVRLAQLINNEPILVFKYSDLNCQTCVDQVFSKIGSVIENIGRERVLLLANYRNPRDLYTFMRVNNIEHTVYNLGERALGIAGEEALAPILFIAYPTGRIDHVFLPDKSLPALTDRYFQLVQQKL